MAGPLACFFVSSRLQRRMGCCWRTCFFTSPLASITSQISLSCEADAVSWARSFPCADRKPVPIWLGTRPPAFSVGTLLFLNSRDVDSHNYPMSLETKDLQQKRMNERNDKMKMPLKTLISGNRDRSHCCIRFWVKATSTVRLHPSTTAPSFDPRNGDPILCSTTPKKPDPRTGTTRPTTNGVPRSVRSIALVIVTHNLPRTNRGDQAPLV